MAVLFYCDFLKKHALIVEGIYFAIFDGFNTELKAGAVYCGLY